ncbi:MAG: LysM peptidoglycan-binding domain-containing protein [Hyphomonadaceae bacterium]
MGDITTRLALRAAGLGLAILCSACALWERPALENSVGFSAASAVTMPGAVEPAAAGSRSSEVLASNAPERFVCVDGSRLEVRYPATNRETIAVSLDGETPTIMRRDDEAELMAYRASNLVLRRSGVRVALASDVTSVTVQSGDSLSLIAIRVYGDRMRAMEIARLNNIDNPDLIYPGQVISLPQMERRCRRSQFEEASYSGDDAQQPLARRLFSPPSARQPDQQMVHATVVDRARH